MAKKLFGKIVYGLIIYMAFHALISTWLISNFGHEILFKSLKDIIVVLMGIWSIAIARNGKIKLDKREKNLLVVVCVS